MAAVSSRGADTRLRLIEAAVSVIGTSGWAAATSRAVAEEAGVNSALVHYHFGSVEQLRRDALMRAVTTEAGGALQALVESPDILAGAVEAMRVLNRHPGAVSLGERVIVEGMVQATRDDDLRSMFAEVLDEIRTMIADRLAEGQAGGLVREDVAVRQLAVAVAALIDGLMLHLYIQPEVRAVEAMRAVVDLARPPAAKAGAIPARTTAARTAKRRSGGS